MSEQGHLNITDTGTINIKQARAFLWNAVWLQARMTARWVAEDKLPDDVLDSCCRDLDGFSLAIMGPGGTGKTAVLKVSEALIVAFCGPETVRKLAPSNAAARLLGGDTMHALCKLPFGRKRLTSKRGRLSSAVLKLHRVQWRNVVAAFVDEISMISADQFMQSNVRIQQAMGPSVSSIAFGNLCVNLCGDFLQLPPVDTDGSRHSLARPLNDEGFVDGHDVEEVEDVSGKKPERKKADVETRQGHDLWRSVSRVVCLYVNIRAPDLLGRLQI